MTRGEPVLAPGKINLALVVGPRRRDGKHELVTVYQRIRLCDRLWLTSASDLRVLGFDEDTIVQEALRGLAGRRGIDPAWHVRIEKQIPVGAGLGGGSSDAARALLVANSTLEQPLARSELHDLASEIGADVPFFLAPGAQLGEGDGTELTPLAIPQSGYAVLVLLPHDARKLSTAAVYEAFDSRGGEPGFEERRAALLEALSSLRRPTDLARLPPNDLASSPLAGELMSAGAFRADVTGAGPAVYALFESEDEAEGAARKFQARGRTWVTPPIDYEPL